MILVRSAVAAPPPDPRDIRNGTVIPDEGYCDQPYVVITHDGNWLCTLTTGKGVEGQRGQHVVATISSDKGKTWSPLIDIEPADGPEASWVMPLVTPTGRVYVFYDYNGDRVDTLGERKNIRADMLGWFVYKYSDDNGRTWSAQRYRLPVRETEYDRINDFGGKVQILWGIGKPIIVGDSAYLGFSKIGKYVIDKSEGWFFRSDNLLTEPDPTRIIWTMLPDGDVGLRAPEGPIAEEQNLVALSDGTLYTMYRTVAGYACHAYSSDGGHTWTPPAAATYTPGGQIMKTPRACPRLWKTSDGKFLFWYHHHGTKSYENRNPAWITGGIEKNGRIHWAQPEILLWDPDSRARMSYPDLVEEDGKYWITETQKSIARVHEVDPALLQGLWSQGEVKKVCKQDLVLDRPKPAAGQEIKLPKLPDLYMNGGFAIDLWLTLKSNEAGQIILDSRDALGRGILLTTAGNNRVRIELCDGNTAVFWESDDGLLTAGTLHHLSIIVDGGPDIITMVIDGTLCDGGKERPFGWGRFSASLGDLNSGEPLRIGPAETAEVQHLRLYNRYLRTSEAVAHYHASPDAQPTE